MRTRSDPGWDRTAEVADLPVFWRQAPAPDPGGGATPLYVHGSPTNSDDFLPFLERTGGIAPDLPGFGRSGKPAAFDYSIRGYARFLSRFLEMVELERLSLVVHDWGAAALALLDGVMDRVDRVVVMNAVPLMPGYRWHRIARLWRTPVVGELTMGFATRWAVERVLREAFAAGGPAPDFFVDRVWDHFDHGTQRAILKLYRSAPSDELARAGTGLGDVRRPALVVWGERDPYISTAFAGAYVEALGAPARLELLDDAGHWPWLDRPDVVDTVASFLAGDRSAG
jgi:pimeloyl-ACP methyl ester carboxylesterase